MSHLEKLDPEIVPAVTCVWSQPDDRGALEHLRLLKHEWTCNIELLASTLDELVDAAKFIEISGKYVTCFGKRIQKLHFIHF